MRRTIVRFKWPAVRDEVARGQERAIVNVNFISDTRATVRKFDLPPVVG